MPQAKIESSSGPALISYTISTPHSSNATAIDRSVPTVLLLHPIYVSQIIFHYQFACPNLRRFNLVAFDARCHGNTVGTVPPTYRQAQAAEDALCLMDALDLPACHLFGVSFGACVALEMALARPTRVLSLVLFSPIPLVELEEVAAGRQEIFDCWAAGQSNPNEPDEDAVLDAMSGALQLGFNQSASRFSKAIIQYILPRAESAWSRAHLDELHTISVKFFRERALAPQSALNALAAAGCPVHLVHCGDDIAYPIECVDELGAWLTQAGLTVRQSIVPDAPHFGCATHPEAVNKDLYAWLLDVGGGVAPPPAKRPVVSPYEADLVHCGLRSEENSDSDDDVFVIPP